MIRVAEHGNGSNVVLDFVHWRHHPMFPKYEMLELLSQGLPMIRISFEFSGYFFSLFLFFFLLTITLFPEAA